MTHRTRETWLIVGASRGIGLEFLNQLLARGDYVYATARNPTSSHLLETATFQHKHSCQILQCDVTDEESIKAMVNELALSKRGDKVKIDYCVLNAGVLQYPNRATEMTFSNFAHHLHTNTIGPIVTASCLLAHSSISVTNFTFISSDSGSATRFNAYEDGFAAYASSKAALNMAIRHMAVELKRKGKNDIVVLAIHPGEVSTDMANIEVDWNVEGVIEADESVRCMIPVIEARSPEESGTFWTWLGQQYPW